ncbi:MAG: hypothetical protein KatS3mg105_0149 [Gemmatales bacterium]|nr:MAG: hypothetical protein KatS3mg105_0149 [Gemmatales bacterium]
MRPKTKGQVVKALDKPGKDAKPLDIQEHIKCTHRIELATNLISNYKNTIVKSLGRPAGKKRG